LENWFPLFRIISGGLPGEFSLELSSDERSHASLHYSHAAKQLIRQICAPQYAGANYHPRCEYAGKAALRAKSLIGRGFTAMLA
jgi:hypothetical protein